MKENISLEELSVSSDYNTVNLCGTEGDGRNNANILLKRLIKFSIAIIENSCHLFEGSLSPQYTFLVSSES